MSAPAVTPSTRPVRTPGPFVNSLLIWLLASRFHRLASASLLVLRYAGRRTGRPHALPVGYAQAGDEFVILVGDPAAKRWWRNFAAPWPAVLLVRGRVVAGTALAVHGDSDEGVRLAAAYFARNPRAARRHGLRIRPGEVADAVMLAAAARELLLVRVRPGG